MAEQIGIGPPMFRYKGMALVREGKYVSIRLEFEDAYEAVIAAEDIVTMWDQHNGLVLNKGK